MPTVEGAGVELAYEERGHGPAHRARDPRHGLRRRAPRRCAEALAAMRASSPTTAAATAASGAPEPYAAHDGRRSRPRTPPRSLRALDAGPPRRGRRRLRRARRARPARAPSAASSRAAVLCEPAAVRVRPRGHRGARRRSASRSRTRCATAARGGGRGLARRPRERRRAGARASAHRAGSSPTTPAWPRGRPAAASCARSPVPPWSSPGPGRRRTSSPRRTRWPGCCRRRPARRDGDVAAAVRALAA